MAANQIELSEMIAKMKPKARAEALACDLTPQAYPFDAIKRAEEVEKVVMQCDKRLYYGCIFQKFYGGVCTARTIGCNIMCAYCWNYSRNLNPRNVKNAKFYSPTEISKRILSLASHHLGSDCRISGAEPFLGEASTRHIAKVLEICDINNFIIETNGILIGKNPSLLDLIKPFNPLVRLTIKADSPIQFEKVTGANGEALEYQFRAYKALKDAGINTNVAIMPQFVDKQAIQRRIKDSIETEDLIVYAGIPNRLEKRGLKEAPKKIIFQRSHIGRKPLLSRKR